jgi:23S rRNA (adenine-N6)-dimethyltransferase
VAQRRRTARDRRRSLGQHFLVDQDVVRALVSSLDLQPGELVVDVGAGAGALTLPLARAGAKVLAVERDRDTLRRLQSAVEREGLASRVQLRRADLRQLPWPRQPFRVVANPPFALTSVLLGRLLDDPTRGPTRADLLLDWGVVRRRTATPADTLRSAAWAPWWRFTAGARVPREAFRPPPSVDTGWLVAERRDPPILPEELAGVFRDAIAPTWQRLRS